MSCTMPGLTTTSLGRTAVWLPTVDSTNLYLKREAARLPGGAVCLADAQTAGRGRRGHTWDTSPGQTLALSVLFKPCSDVAALPLACGLAVAQALTAVCQRAVEIKWPNDSICAGAKVCGILCESAVVDGQSFAVAGMGVNLLQTADDFARAGLPHAASLAMLTGQILPPDKVAVAILNRLEPLWQQTATGGFAAIRDDYARHCVTLGREVRVLGADGRVLHTGQAVGLADDGCLLVRGADGTHAVRAGEVSIRGRQGYV